MSGYSGRLTSPSVTGSERHLRKEWIQLVVFHHLWYQGKDRRGWVGVIFPFVFVIDSWSKLRSFHKPESLNCDLFC